jgi:hypothetical protein
VTVALTLSVVLVVAAEAGVAASTHKEGRRRGRRSSC